MTTENEGVVPDFNIGDKVQVPDDMEGAEHEWLGRQGVVKRISGHAHGNVSPGARRAMKFEPIYEVLFDGEEKVVLIEEDFLQAAEEE